MFKVMLVDDETKILEGLSVMIDWNKYGFEICARARNGSEALKAARLWEPELIVTDIQMPQMDGLELIRQWKAIHTLTHFIILSGYSEFKYAKQAMQLGVRHYVLKPIEETGLEACLIEVAQDIMSLREEESELSLLRRHSEAYLKLQRENMLRDWVHAGKHAEEIVANLAELDVLFPYSNCHSIALLKENRELWSELDMDAACKIMAETIPMPAIVYPFRFEEGELGLMFNFARRGTDEEVKEWSLQFHQKLSKHCGSPITLGMGSIVRSMHDLNESYRVARGSLGEPTALDTAVPQQQQQVLHRRSIVDEIKAYIDLHYDEQLTLTSIAESFFIHAHYLSQLFRKKTGVTFLHYLTYTRMEHAKRLLLTTDLKVYEISRLVGYEDSKYFSRIFERTVGMKPSEFKQTFTKE